MTEKRSFVVWADPGLTTGLAWHDLESGLFNSWQYDVVDLRTQLDRLADTAADRMAVGYEKYIVTSGGPRTGSPQHALKAIQTIEDFARVRQVPLLVPQPSSARKLGQVVYLRRLGWYKPGKPHANDAAQHLLADLLRTAPMPHTVRSKLFPGYKTRDTLAP